MEELQNSTAEAKTPAESRWYEGVGLEDAETYIRANLKSAARSVIAIGYYLKCVKAKELFAEAGFKDIYEYARERFGFSSSTTSRYMTRNDKFSINGNSPLLDEKYKDFSKSQLQEMLSLDAEQLETVTPDMTVAQIREMKRPKEIPYVAIPGQREMLADFPGITPEDVAAAAKAREAAATGHPETSTYTISAEDLLPDPEPQETEQSIAISQQEPKLAQPERAGKCIHRPDLDFECSLAEEYKHIPGDGTNCDRACCWDCTERSKGCRLECYSSERRPEEPHEEQSEEPAAVVQQEPEEQIPTEQTPIERGCITGLSRYGNCVCCGYDGVECCAQCDESCNSRCGWLEDEKNERKDTESDTARSTDQMPDKVTKDNIGGVPVYSLENKLTVDGAYGRQYSEIIKVYLRELHRDESYTIANQILPMEFQVLGDTYKAKYDGCCYVSFKNRQKTIMFVELDRLKAEYAEKYQSKKAKPVETYDKSILQSMIKFEKEHLDAMGPAWIEKQPYHYTKHMMALEAYRMLLAAHEEEHESKIIG